MHRWGDKNVDWDGLNKAAEYIGFWLRRWARMNVRDCKEKWGTVRVYCDFGWYAVHDITHPGYHYIQISPKIAGIQVPNFINNWLVIPIHKKLYRLRYKRALKKWPHLRKEILCCADHTELLEGL